MGRGAPITLMLLGAPVVLHSGGVDELALIGTD
jgi:hypothetical protein